MKSFNLHLYLVTDEAAKCRHSLLETVRKAVDGGVTIVPLHQSGRGHLLPGSPAHPGLPGGARNPLHCQQPH